MKLLENYAKSLVENHGKALVENHGNTLSKARKKKRWNIMQHYFGRKPMDTPWWKTMEHSDWETHGKLLVENNGKALVDNKGKPLLENCRQNDGKLGKPLTTSGGKPRRNNIH